MSSDIRLDPYLIAKDRRLFELAIKGDPVPASRPRVARNGGVFYPKRYTEYRASLAGYLRLARYPLPAENRRFGVRAFFFRKNKQRSDVDNLLKSVLDGGNGILWQDDAQVIEVFGRISRSSDNPRVELLVYEIAD